MFAPADARKKDCGYNGNCGHENDGGGKDPKPKHDDSTNSNLAQDIIKQTKHDVGI
jgi:hypothetical protein